MIKLFQKIAKAIASAIKTTKALGRMGIRKAGNFSRAALGTVVNMLGGGGRFQQPEPEDDIETVPDMSGLDEALAQLNADMDDDKQDELNAQTRALTDGMEPKDIYDYSKADGVEQREEIAMKMRKSTREWVQGLTDDHHSRIAKAGEDGVRYHIMDGIRPIPGVPAFPKNNMENVAEFKQQEPAAVKKVLKIDLADARIVAEASAKDPLQNAMPVAGNSPRKPVKGKAADEPELDYDRGYAPQPGFARLR